MNPPTPLSVSSLRLVLSAALACAAVISPRAAHAQSPVPAGAGSYWSSTPTGFERPVNTLGSAVFPRTSATFAGPPQTNEWWSSLIWQRDTLNAYGSQMYPLPLAMKAQPDGLDIGYVKTPAVFSTGYNFPLSNSATAMRLSVSGIGTATMLVDGAGDWSVSPKWTGNGRTLKLWMARGSPFVYADLTGGNAEVKFNSGAGTATVWYNAGNTLGVTINGASYGLFAPAGATWSVASGVATSTLAGKTYYSVAALPEQSTAALNLFASRAMAFVTDTRMAWTLDTATSKVNVAQTFVTTMREGAPVNPLVTMFRHEWLRSSLPTLGMSYITSRGEAKLVDTAVVTAAFEFGGIVPNFPDTGAVTQTRLWQLVNQVYLETDLNPSSDSYGSGKAYGRIAQLIPLAEQCGHTAAKTRFINFLRDELSDWYTAGNVTTGGTDAYSAIQAEAFTSASPEITIGASPTGQAALGITGGSWLRFANVNFASGVPSRLVVNFASGTQGSGSFEVLADSVTGTVIAGGGVGSTGGVDTWVDVPLSMTSAGRSLTGIHDVYLRVTTPYEGELMRIDSFKFDRSGLNNSDRCFAYDQNWKTLIAHPASFGLGSEMNDHHFHYGYFIMASAMLARYDPAWATAYGPMVELLIRDAANYDRNDTRFPMLRNFDPYAGYSYASGHATFFAGNNQESSSEGMNFSNGCFLWGSVTGNTAVRDLGAMLYSVENAAIQQYWFDADNAVYPAAVSRKMAGLVWSYGAEYATWFSGNPWQIHGINFLPLTAGSTYLGRRPDAMLKNWNILQSSLKPSDATVWLDINYGMLATADANLANQLLTANPNYSPEAGDSRARTEHWIKTWQRVGKVDVNTWADVPTYAAFKNKDVSHRFAWNPSSAPLTVHWNDGRSMVVAPGQVGYYRDFARVVEMKPIQMNAK